MHPGAACFGLDGDADAAAAAAPSCCCSILLLLLLITIIIIITMAMILIVVSNTCLRRYALDTLECGRSPNYWSTSALEWSAATLLDFEHPLAHHPKLASPNSHGLVVSV